MLFMGKNFFSYCKLSIKRLFCEIRIHSLKARYCPQKGTLQSGDYNLPFKKRVLGKLVTHHP